MTAPPPDWSAPAVVLLVGAAASGKTTLRRRLVDEGLPAHRVVSLDELRRELRDRSDPGRPAQDLTLPALAAAARRQAALLEAGEGYLLDATSLRRRERVPHVAAAAGAGLPAVAVLLPVLPLEELARRNAGRPPDEVVPDDALRRQAHRHGLLTPELLEAEGFVVVQP